MKQNNWFDPFFILENLSQEEKLIQKNVKDFSNNVLRPIVVAQNRDHKFDRHLYREFGRLGQWSRSHYDSSGEWRRDSLVGFDSFDLVSSLSFFWSATS